MFDVKIQSASDIMEPGEDFAPRMLKHWKSLLSENRDVNELDYAWHCIEREFLDLRIAELLEPYQEAYKLYQELQIYMIEQNKSMLHWRALHD